MLKFRFAKIYILLIVLLLSACKTSTVIRNDDPVNKKNNDVVVGLLSTQQETFSGEYKNPAKVTRMLSDFGAKVILIDYNQVVDFDLIRNITTKKSKKNKRKQKNLESQLIYRQVLKFVKENGINRILIPGNYYNISSAPLPPTPYRQLITNALVRIANKNPQIYFMGICGGLQGIMATNGIEVIRVEKMIHSIESIETHTISMPDPTSTKAPLRKIMVDPASRFGSIVYKHNPKYQNGWLIVYLPDAHSESINNKPSNIQKLHSLGYKIVAYSEDGIIEAIEDNYGNIYFQSHPEYLAINANKKRDKNNHKKDSSVLISTEIMKDFLYRRQTLQ